MPWSPGEATRFTKKASSPAKRRQWAAVADSALGAGDSEATAIKKASGVLAKISAIPAKKAGRRR